VHCVSTADSVLCPVISGASQDSHIEKSAKECVIFVTGCDERRHRRDVAR
jgi:hypothetical protein